MVATVAEEVRQTFLECQNPEGIYNIHDNFAFLLTNPRYDESIGFNDEQAYVIRKNRSEWAHDGTSMGPKTFRSYPSLVNAVVATAEEVGLAKSGKLTLKMLAERGIITSEQFIEMEKHWFNR